jgi:hypothetical protein
MFKFYKVVAQDLNNAKVINFDTYENAHNWVMADNWYFEKAIFEVEIVAGKGGVLEENTEKVFEEN